MPKDFSVRLLEQNLEGQVDVRVTEEAGRKVRTYLAQNMERVLPEPQAPPLYWILPHVEFSRDVEVEE